MLLVSLTFLPMIEKISEHRLKEKISIFLKNIALFKNWFVVSMLHKFPEHHMAN